MRWHLRRSLSVFSVSREQEIRRLLEERVARESLNNDKRCAPDHRGSTVQLLDFRREDILHRQPWRAPAEDKVPFLAFRHLERVRLVTLVRAERREERRQAPHEDGVREFSKVVCSLRGEGFARRDFAAEGKNETDHGETSVDDFRRPTLKRENFLRRLHLGVDL